MLVRTLLLLLSLHTLPALAAEQTTEDVLDLELAAIAQEFSIPALSVAVIASGKLVYASGTGHIDNHQKVNTTADTAFRVASISKLFTAQAVMQLIEQERLSLSDPIGDYIPAFRQSPITILQLLTHTSGLEDALRPEGGEGRKPTDTYLSLISASAPLGESAHEFAYSDTGFNLLGAIVASVSGMPFDDYVQQNVLNPVEMQHTGYYDGRRGIAPEAPPTYQGKVLTPELRRPFDPSFYPSEGLVSTASDLGRWLVATLNRDSRLLASPSYAQMLEPRVKTSWGDIQVGLAWQVYEKDSRFVARHPGSVRGYKSLIISYPEERNAIVLLTNAAKAPRFEIADRLTENLRDMQVWE